jgi:hypothetical protein
MKTTMTIVTYHDEGIVITAEVAEALAAIRSQEQSGTDDVTSHNC